MLKPREPDKAPGVGQSFWFKKNISAAQNIFGRHGDGQEASWIIISAEEEGAIASKKKQCMEMGWSFAI